MSFRGIRHSKFRHVYGQAMKKDQCYENIRITKSSWDSTFCVVNPKFLAIITEAAGGGSFLVLPLEKTGRVDRDTPLVVGHKAAVLDIQWSPHDDHIIASGSEDCTVKVWQIPADGLTQNLDEPFRDLVLHQRRVGLVVWHPIAHNILLSGGSDNRIVIWNVEAGEAIYEVELADIPLSASWSWCGDKVVVSSKDKKVRVIDPRKDLVLHEACCHDSNKSTQALFLRNDHIFTTGFSRVSERQYALWDASLNNITTVDLDNSNGILYPFYDPDLSIVYLCGKGDCMIQYIEVTDEAPYLHYLSKFQSSDPQRGFGCMCKRGLNVHACEIARFYKLHAKGLCEVIPMTVPRKSELFQDDLYPDTLSNIPSMSAQQWIAGKNTPPIMMSLREADKTKPFASVVQASIAATPRAATTATATPKTTLHATTATPYGHFPATPKAPPPHTTPHATPSTKASCTSHTSFATPVASKNSSSSSSNSVYSAASASSGRLHADSCGNAAPAAATTSTPKRTPGYNARKALSTDKAASLNCAGHSQESMMLENLVDDIRKLKIIAKGHEKRIKLLEEKLTAYEVEDEEEEDDDYDGSCP